MILNELVYENNFESEKLEYIDGGIISKFNNTNGIGISTDGFVIHLENIKDHDFVFISFDLFIHGSWDSVNGLKKIKPDFGLLI